MAEEYGTSSVNKWELTGTKQDPSDECYACKLLEVMIVHCHHSLIQVGEAGTQVGGVRPYKWVGGVTGGRGQIIQVGGVRPYRWVGQGHRWAGKTVQVVG